MKGYSSYQNFYRTFAPYSKVIKRLIDLTRNTLIINSVNESFDNKNSVSFCLS